VKIARNDGGFLVEHPDGGWITLDRLGLTAADTAAVIAQRGALATALDRGGPGDDIDVRTLRRPIVRPGKVLAIGMNYMDHIRETGAKVPERPVLFAKFPNSLNDPYGDVVMDRELTGQGDYEVELAAVIGTRTRGISEEDALGSVFAYTVANDVSARDWQSADAQISRSKSFDTFCPIGPWLVTADEIADPQALALRSWVNGELRQDSSTAEMLFTLAELIAFIARGMTLEPGDVLLTGTPHGVGFAMDPPRFIVPGDVVRCEVQGIGTIENRVVGPPGG
jgi:5-carboxymethyl-2-hydroxymuconate isomerase